MESIYNVISWDDGVVAECDSHGEMGEPGICNQGPEFFSWLCCLLDCVSGKGVKPVFSSVRWFYKVYHKR